MFAEVVFGALGLLATLDVVAEKTGRYASSQKSRKVSRFYRRLAV